MKEVESGNVGTDLCVCPDVINQKRTKKVKLIFLTVLVAMLCMVFISQSQAYELSGYITAEGRVFFNEPLYPEQDRDSASIAAQPEFYHEWENGSSFIFTPFARLDSADSERSHVDIREFNYLWLGSDWELRVGVGKVFWGVTEFLHLVDIINQTDAVEYIDGEDKLGQPMVHLSIPRDWGVVDLFVLPYFRERTFPGKDGRFRSQIVVDTDEVIYESSEEEYHIDFAVRYSHTIGDWDFGVYHFNGTGREPTLLSRSDSTGNLFFAPFYEQIDQTGLDVQMVRGSWLFKLESLYRSGQGDGYFAGIGGFEYSFVNIRASGIDLGLIGEWAYDERGDEATTGFDNDLTIGTRLAFNDAESTEALMGITQDLDSAGTGLSFESSRRIGDHWKVTVDAFFIVDSSEEDSSHSFRDDDNIQIELSYYF
jgi:hypothetical protein